jgi:hypothetical protein
MLGSNFIGGSWFWPLVVVSRASPQMRIVRRDNMEKEDQELAAMERSKSLDQMKSKIQTLAEKMLRGMQQPELAKIAISVQSWQDDFGAEEQVYIPGPPSAQSPKRFTVPNPTKEEERLRDWTKKVRHKLAQTGKDDLISVIIEETDRMSLSHLQHLSQSLIALQRRKR